MCVPQAVTGDTLISVAAAGQRAADWKAASRQEKKSGVERNEKSADDGIASLPGVKIPEPVFFCTVETETAADQPGESE